MEKILPPNGLADVPVGIDENQVRRPHELAQIKPDRATRNESTFDKRIIIISSLRSDQVPLYPGGNEPAENPHDEKGNQRQHILFPGQFLPLPPENHQQGRRQRGNHAF
jgi:hypothetical protein